MNKLADELLKEILAPPLLVDDAIFADTSSSSPFAKVQHSASDVLLVCKRWMRVATPTLFNTVVIRTKAQAHALNLALTRNPAFGQNVKRLRLEGAYGEFLTASIMRTMPRVQHLCFTLGVYADDRLHGLNTALQLYPLQHITLTCCQPKRTRNKAHKKLVQNLCEAIEASTTLRTFAFSGERWYNEITAQSGLCSALAKCKSLETVSGRTQYLVQSASEGLQDLLRSKVKITIYCDSPPSFNSNNSISPELAARITYISPSQQRVQSDTTPLAPIAPPVNEFWHPMQFASKDVREDIWTKILTYTLYRPMKDALSSHWARRYPRSDLFRDEYNDVAFAAKLLMLSKDICSATLRVLARDVVCRSPDGMAEYLAMRRRDPAIKMHRLDFNLYHTAHNTEDQLEEFFQGEISLRRANIHLYINKLDIFTWMEPTLSSLVELTLNGRVQLHRTSKLPFANMFGKLVNLESLSWGLADLQFTTAGMTATAAKAFLPKLEKITFTACHSSFWTAASRCGLPRFRRLSLNSGVRKAESFLHVHGRKITHLVVSNGLKQADMALMPNLTFLQLQAMFKPYSINDLSHPNLQTLQFGWMVNSGKISAKQHQVFYALRAGAARQTGPAFPNLHEVIVKPGEYGNMSIWPTNERETRKSAWPALSATLDEMGITLKDASGFAYRKRMTLAPGAGRRTRGEGSGAKQKALLVREAEAEDDASEGNDGDYKNYGPETGNDHEGGGEEDDVDGDDDEDEEDVVMDDDDDSDYRG